MKKIGSVALALLSTFLALPVAAQDLQPDSLVLAALWDADSGSFTYCNTLGIAGNPAGRNKLPPSSAKISTSGSSTTVTAVDAAVDAFANVAVGDPLWINDDGVQLQRVVTARASADSITINAAVDITGASWSYRTLTCGTADTSGAVPVSGFHSLTFQIGLAQENSTSTDYQLECRVFGPATVWNILSGPTNDTTTFQDVVTTTIGFDECRVGIKVNTDDGDDLTTNAEQFTILLNRRR